MPWKSGKKVLKGVIPQQKQISKRKKTKEELEQGVEQPDKLFDLAFISAVPFLQLAKSKSK